MKRIAETPWPAIARQAWEDIQPFPGRLGLTWRVSLLCALVAGVAMMLKIPEAAISCYLVIFLSKEDSVTNCIMAFGVIILASTVVLIMIPLINMTIDSPQMRLAVMFFISYIFLFLSSTTPLGEQAAIVALIVAFLMTLVSMVPVGEIGTEGLKMAWKMACMPMFLMIGLNLLLGIPSQVHVRNLIIKRLRCSAEQIRSGTVGTELPELVRDGNDVPLQQMMLVKLLHLISKAESTWMNGAVETSYRILLACQDLPSETGPEARAALANALENAADRIENRDLPSPPQSLPTSTNDIETDLHAALAGLSREDGGGQPKPRPVPFLAADAFTNPDHTRYALQTSVSAVLCYLIYTGLQWDGIHTAMITVYVAALGTTGETLRKLSLRIVGCLIGAAIGALSLLYVMPHLTSIGGLMGMVFVGLLGGAWVAAGNERIYYAGVQIGLAFLLTTLNGFGPSFEFSQASDRIYGILLGILVIYLIFTQFWPRSVMTPARKSLIEAIEALEALTALAAEDQRVHVEHESSAQIALTKAEEMIDMAPFEPRGLKASPEDIQELREAAGELRGIARELYYAPVQTGPAYARLEEIKARLTKTDTDELDSQSPGLPQTGASQ